MEVQRDSVQWISSLRPLQPSQSQKVGSFKTEQMQRDMNRSVGDDEKERQKERERMKLESQVPPGFYDTDVDNWTMKFQTAR